MYVIVKKGTGKAPTLEADYVADLSCFQSYQSAVGGLTTVAACDHLVQSAFVDYCRGRLSDAEYSNIYYACDSRSLEIRTSYKRIRPAVIR